MGRHPVNLLFRFILELFVLGVAAFWSWRLFEGWPGTVLAIVIPFVMALIWGSFAVPDDPSRSGKAAIPISGPLRLLLELLFFSFAVWCVYDLGLSGLAKVLAFLILLHYVISWDRIRWLLKQT
ncbi:MAG: YrdB family protein [Lutimonas sp.]